MVHLSQRELGVGRKRVDRRRGTDFRKAVLAFSLENEQLALEQVRGRVLVVCFQNLFDQRQGFGKVTGCSVGSGQEKHDSREIPTALEPSRVG